MGDFDMLDLERNIDKASELYQQGFKHGKEAERRWIIKENCMLCGSWGDKPTRFAEVGRPIRWKHKIYDHQWDTCPLWKTHERVYQEGLKDG